MLFRKPGSDTVLVLDRSFQNLVEGGKRTFWKVSLSLEGFESGYSLGASEAG